MFASLAASFLQAGQADLSAMKEYLMGCSGGSDANKFVAYVDGFKCNSKGLPLHIAAQYGDLALTELALAKGAVVNLTDDHYCTPLKWAVLGNHKEVAETLIKNGASIKGQAGINLLEIGIENNFLEMVKLLVANKVAINVNLSTISHSPLSCAAVNGYRKIVTFLLKNGADMNYMIESPRGKVTPLIAAIDGACPDEDEDHDEERIINCTKIACKLIRGGTDLTVNNGVSLLEKCLGKYCNYLIMNELLLRGMVPTDSVFKFILVEEANLEKSLEENRNKEGKREIYKDDKAELRQLQKITALATLNLKIKQLKDAKIVSEEKLKNHIEELEQKLASLTSKKN